MVPEVHQSVNHQKLEYFLEIMEVRKGIIEPVQDNKYLRDEFPIINGLEPFQINTSLDTDKGIIFVHGLAGTPFDFSSIALRLAYLPAVLSSVRLPGHGTCDSDLANYGKDDWVQAVRNEIINMNSRGIRQILLVGHSIGAIISFILAQEFPSLVKSVISLAAPLNFPMYKRYLLKVLRKSPLAMARPDVHVVDPTVKALAIWDEILDNYQTIPFSILDDAVSLCQEVKNRMHKVEQPILILQSTEDRVSGLDDANDLFQKASSKQKYMRIFEKGGHLMMVDEDYEEVEYEINAFIERLFEKENSLNLE